jgi:hypothetical protein
MRDDGGALSEDHLERLARYFDEEVIAAKNNEHARDTFLRPPDQGRGARIAFHSGVTHRVGCCALNEAPG